mmetsp:Transcript_31990/g.77319  ORF Transcript_31990/g.77319 Transcript_31990/m.77319 type:complete len:226 (+) Transcript_31990:163-840(+)
MERRFRWTQEEERQVDHGRASPRSLRRCRRFVAFDEGRQVLPREDGVDSIIIVPIVDIHIFAPAAADIACCSILLIHAPPPPTVVVAAIDNQIDRLVHPSQYKRVVIHEGDGIVLLELVRVQAHEVSNPKVVALPGIGMIFHVRLQILAPLYGRRGEGWIFDGDAISEVLQQNGPVLRRTTPAIIILLLRALALLGTRVYDGVHLIIVHAPRCRIAIAVRVDHGP